MHQTKKGNQWHFGMKAHIGVDADSGLVHTVATTPANAADVELVHELLHGQEQVVHADSGYTGADKRVQRKKLEWQIAAKRGGIKAMADGREKRKLEAIEKRKASVRAKVEHPFRGDQAPVRLDEGALPRFGEEHGACDHAVRAVESVDGTTAVVGDDGIVASAAPESATSGPETRVAGSEKPKSVVIVSPKASDANNEGLFEGLIRPSQGLEDGPRLDGARSTPGRRG